MEMSAEQLVPASQQQTWEALNDPQMLKQCVPGCESIEPIAENQYQVLMVARVGPVSAKFKGKLTLSDIEPPNSYSIAFEGQGGAAGFAKGGAQVRLTPDGESTRLAYDVKASVGGKLAQIGSRLVDAAAKKVADDFFRNFNQKVGAAHASEDTTVVLEPPPTAEKEHDEHGKPIPRDPQLPDVSKNTLMMFAAGALIVVGVAVYMLLH
jgi:uncharacterized protein